MVCGSLLARTHSRSRATLRTRVGNDYAHGMLTQGYRCTAAVAWNRCWRMALAGLGLACAANAHAAHSLSVSDCVRLARLHAPEVLITGAAREAARQDSLLHGFDQRPAGRRYKYKSDPPK